MYHVHLQSLNFQYRQSSVKVQQTDTGDEIYSASLYYDAARSFFHNF